MQKHLAEDRYKLYAKRAVLQAHLEIIESAIQQHNRYFDDHWNLREPMFRKKEDELFERYMNDLEGN